MYYALVTAFAPPLARKWCPARYAKLAAAAFTAGCMLLVATSAFIATRPLVGFLYFVPCYAGGISLFYLVYMLHAHAAGELDNPLNGFPFGMGSSVVLIRTLWWYVVSMWYHCSASLLAVAALDLFCMYTMLSNQGPRGGWASVCARWPGAKVSALPCDIAVPC